VISYVVWFKVLDGGQENRAEDEFSQDLNA